MPSSISSFVIDGTNPRIPTSKKTKPKRIAAVFTIITSYWIKTSTLMAVGPCAGKPKTWNECAFLVSKIDNMKRAFFAFLLGIASVPIVDLSYAEDSSHANAKTAVLAGGCLWCIHPAFDKAPGVIKTLVGYCGGTEPNPNNQSVCSEKTGYRESIEITYYPAKISFAQLL